MNHKYELNYGPGCALCGVLWEDHDKMLQTLWKITIVSLKDDGEDFVVCVATKGRRDRVTAVKMARALHNNAWWEEWIITSVEEIGGLSAVEGVELPEGDPRPASCLTTAGS